MDKTSKTYKSNKPVIRNHTYKKDMCSPAIDKKNDITCYSDTTLETLKQLWNKKHTNDIINASDPLKIWENLREKFENVCDSERCWLRQNFANGKLGDDITQYTFAPVAPESWSAKPKDWLSSIDISSVMSHFEKYYSQFSFIGPSPIDFDADDVNGTCVWPELCNFELKKMIVKRKMKIGVIFNTDIHTGEGEHWVSMFIDLSAKPTPYIFYFDSAGDRIKDEVNMFVGKVIAQAETIGMDLKFYENTKVHQKGKSECGMYSLYLIIELLTGKKNYTYFLENRVPDKAMSDFRNIYFNKYS